MLLKDQLRQHIQELCKLKPDTIPAEGRSGHKTLYFLRRFWELTAAERGKAGPWEAGRAGQAATQQLQKQHQLD